MSNGEYEDEGVEPEPKRGEELAKGGPTSSNSGSGPGGVPGDAVEDLGDELTGGTGDRDEPRRSSP